MMGFFNTITKTYIDLSTALFIFWVHVVDSSIIDYNIICHLSNSSYILYSSKLCECTLVLNYLDSVLYILFVSSGNTESAVSVTNLIFYKNPSSVLFYEVYVVSNPLKYYTLVDQQKIVKTCKPFIHTNA